MRHLKNFRFFLFLIILTLLIRPWRNSVSQDDASYAAQAIEFAKSHFSFHPDTVATLLPQTFLGLLILKILPNVPPLILLNSLTWTCFLAFVLGIRKRSGFSSTLLVSFFSIPFWFQYGASDLYDIYAVCLLGLLFYLDTQESRRPSLWIPVSQAGVSFLAILQLQTLAVFPAALVALHVWKKQFQRAILLSISILAGLFVFYLLPKSLTQQAAPFWMARSHPSLLAMASLGIQLFCGLGFFLLPLSLRPHQISRRLLWGGGLTFLLLFLSLWGTQLPILAAGVFFSDYLPRPLAAFLAVVGFWGWVGTFDLWKKVPRAPLITMAGAIAVLFSAYALRSVPDLRYALVAVPAVLYLLIEQLRVQTWKNRLGNMPPVAAGLLLGSLVLNLYQLDTTEKRWQTANWLEKMGANPKEISAGYGRDHFTLEWECITQLYQKLNSPALSSSFYQDEIYRYIPRVYQKGWVPRYLVKPYQFFGKKLSLPFNQQTGQNQEPTQIIQYRSLGISHSLAVFENQSSEWADCFRMPFSNP